MNFKWLLLDLLSYEVVINFHVFVAGMENWVRWKISCPLCYRTKQPVLRKWKHQAHVIGTEAKVTQPWHDQQLWILLPYWSRRQSSIFWSSRKSSWNQSRCNSQMWSDSHPDNRPNQHHNKWRAGWMSQNKLVDQVDGEFQIAENSLHSRPVNLSGFMHELTNFVNCIRDIWTSQW